MYNDVGKQLRERVIARANVADQLLRSVKDDLISQGCVHRLCYCVLSAGLREAWSSGAACCGRVLL